MNKNILQRYHNHKMRVTLIKSIYNAQTILKEIEEERIIHIVGKKEEAKLLNKLGFVSTVITNRTLGFLRNYAEYFKSAKVIILYKNNEKEVAEKITRELEDYVYQIKSVVLSSSDDVDLKKIVKNKSELNKLKQRINSVNWKYAKWIIREDKNSNGIIKVTEKINEGILNNCIRKTLKYELIGNCSSKEGLLYVYKQGVYKEISFRMLKGYVAEYIPTHLVTDRVLSSVANLLITKKETKDYSILEGKENIINFKNGLYNVETSKLVEHNPDYITQNQFDMNFNKRPVNNGYWDKFMDSFTMGDIEMKNILQEWVGLILSNYNGSLVKKMLILYGDGDTGKSKFIDLLVKMLCEKRTKVLDLEDLGQRFVLGDLERTRLIHSAELVPNSLGTYAVKILKKLTGEDMLRSEKKFVDSTNAGFKGVLVYGANELPKVNGNVLTPIFNRLMFIPCINVIETEKQDPQLVSKLFKDKEYIFQWALEGLKRLKDNNFKFSYSKKAEIIKNKYIQDVDNVSLFIEDNCTSTQENKDRIKTTELYEAYIKWCEINSYEVCNKKDFRIRVCNIGFNYNRKYQGYPMYEGLKFNELEDVVNK